MLGISVVVVPPATPAQAQGGCALCENDLPAGDVEGEEGAFVGSAALVSPGGEVFDSGAGSAGAHVVELTTNWWGTFHVGGYGPYDIETPATQGPYRLALTVTEGRSLLVE